jgi:hypothetical protein
MPDTTALGDEFFVQTFATTLQKYERKLVDQVMLSSPILELFKKESKSHTGRGLVIPIRAANLGSTGYSDASGTHSTAVSAPVIGSAVYGWALPVITPNRLRHQDILQNSGPEALVNLVEEYVKGAVEDHSRFLTNEIHATGLSWQPGSVNSLDLLVGDAASDAAVAAALGSDWAPIGGIDPNVAGKEYWQATRVVSDPDDEDIVTAMRKLSNEIFRVSRKKPTHVIAGFDVFEEVESYLQEKGIYNDPSGTAELRWSEVKFSGLVVRLDPDAPVDRAYFLNRDSLRFGYANGEFMKTYPKQNVQGTLDYVVPTASTIQLGLAERRCNGLLVRSTPAGS